VPELNADIDGYLRAAGLNATPPPVNSDQPVAGATPTEQLLWALGLAANSADPLDSAATLEEHALREAALAEAAEKFLAQDEAARGELDSVGGVGQDAALTQQLPQLAAGVAGTLSGALGAALQPLAQLPQQLMQGVQQAAQAGVGLIQQMTAAEAFPSDDFGDLDGIGDLGDSGDFGGPADFGDLGGEFGAPDGVAGLGGFGGGLTPPGAGAGVGLTALGPPATPSPATPSPATTVSAAAGRPGAATSTVPPPPVGPGGMAGFPMVPPAGLHGTPGDRDAKPDTKRVSVPTVRNGAPVTGRLTPAPTVPAAARSVDGIPVATRRDTGVTPAP